MLYLIGGSPCSGKSTIAAHLAERFQLIPIKLDDLVEGFTQAARRDGAPISTLREKTNSFLFVEFFLAPNMNRLIMTKQGRYYDETPYQLEQKLAENRWLIELADRLDIDIQEEMET